MTVTKYKLGSIVIETKDAHLRPVYTVQIEGSQQAYQVGYSACQLLARKDVEWYLESFAEHEDFDAVVCYILGSEHIHAHNMVNKANDYLNREAA